jgi:hypothetical protein
MKENLRDLGEDRWRISKLTLPEQKRRLQRKDQWRALIDMEMSFRGFCTDENILNTRATISF